MNTMDRYAGITTNEECQQLFVAHMQVLQEMPKNQRLLWVQYAGIALNAKCLQLI